MKKIFEFGNRLSGIVANAAGQPLGQVIVVLFCGAWFLIGSPAADNAFTLVLSVMAITLTQMVLISRSAVKKPCVSRSTS